MAYLQRVSFRQVSIAADADTLGRVLMGAWPDWANPDSCEYREPAAYDYFLRRARVSLAGQIAEAYHLGKPPRSGMHIDNFPARPMRGSALPLRRSVSGGWWRGDPAVRQEQESRKSPDSVRFLGYL